MTAPDGSRTWDVPVIYSDNVEAGTAHVSAGLLDVAGYTGSYTFGLFTIDKAPTSALMTCPVSVGLRGEGDRAL